MAQQTINIGVSANDGSGDPLRTAYTKANENFTELYDAIAALQAAIITATDILRAGTGTATGTTNERVDYSSEFTADCQISIIDPVGVGVQVTSQDATGFYYDSLSAGNFGYTALINA